MEKLILFIICFLCSSGLYAQNDHLSFIGIPIDGTITEFQEKLEEKGIRHDVKGSAELPVGQRNFKGFFEGKNCDILVYYAKSSKTVYRIKVFMAFNERQYLEQMFYRMNDLLKREFVIEKEENNENEQLSAFKAPNGDIALYTMNFEFGYGLSTYTLHLEFIDSINSKLPDAE